MDFKTKIVTKDTKAQYIKMSIQQAGITISKYFPFNI